MLKIFKNKYIIISIILLLIIGLSGTYSLYEWGSTGEQSTDVSVTILNSVKVLYYKGNDISNVSLIPSLTKQGVLKEIQVSLDKSIVTNPTINFYLDIVTLQAGLKHRTFKWEFSKNGNIIASGSFENEVEGTTINLTSDQSMTELKDFYTLLVYIDGTESNPTSMMNQTFSFILRADGQNVNYEEVDVFDGTVNRPNLSDGMIPIKHNGVTWVKADESNTDSDWYDYDNKIWANAVMVKETGGTKTRAAYMTAPVNTIIEEADILAYLVWIPRYKYQLFNVAYTGIAQREIQIAYEEGTERTGTVTCTTNNMGVETCTNKVNGNWYTHPAFKLGNEELTGIWVGKFETTPTATTPTIKPNVASLRTQVVSAQFATSRKFNSLTYVTSKGVSRLDAHMMKNIEWGAVAYLTQSKYGRCTAGVCEELSINDSSGYFTGRSSGAPGSASTVPTENGTYWYDTPEGQTASTTNNIYGIYDMSGGAWEYTMGVLVHQSGRLYSGYSVLYNSGFTGIYTGEGTGIINGVNFPNEKYYDRYAYGTSYTDQTAYNRSHLGDATGEVRSWNGDYAYFVSSAYPWLLRGGGRSNGVIAGVFCFYQYRGNADSSGSFRLVSK